MAVKYRVVNIEWFLDDLTQEEKERLSNSLPNETIVTIPDEIVIISKANGVQEYEDVIEPFIRDWLCNTYGCVHYGFECEKMQ